MEEWERKELVFLVIYALGFYAFIIWRSLILSRDHEDMLYGLSPGWLLSSQQPRLNDISDAQWRNFSGNLPFLSLFLGIIAALANGFRAVFSLKAKGMSLLWLSFSLAYLSYLHGACVIFILAIASLNFLLFKSSGARTKYFPLLLWAFNLFFLLSNRVYQGYSFSLFGKRWTYLDNFRGTFRWHICFNFVVLRMISFGYDYYWAHQGSRFDPKKHIQRCRICQSGKACYQALQEKSVSNDKFTFSIYISYLVYAPLYVAGPILGFNAFASQKSHVEEVM